MVRILDRITTLYRGDFPDLYLFEGQFGLRRRPSPESAEGLSCISWQTHRLPKSFLGPARTQGLGRAYDMVPFAEEISKTAPMGALR